MYCFCTADPPICAIPAFLENSDFSASNIAALVFSSICGKIESIGEVAEFSGGVRVLPEELVLQHMPSLKIPSESSDHSVKIRCKRDGRRGGSQPHTNPTVQTPYRFLSVL